MAKVIIPPLFSIYGKLNIGQSMTLVLADAIIRYLQQKGEEVLFHSKSYNSQGIPIEKAINKEDLSQIDESRFVSKTNDLISRMEKDKKRLNLSDGDYAYFDHSQEMRKLSQKMFIELYSKGYVFSDKKEWYLDSPKILRDELFRTSLNNLKFQPNSFFNRLEQMINDISIPLKISKSRKFATPIPCDSKLSLDPLWDLTTQHFSLPNSPPTIQICGRNMANRYVFYSLLTSFAMNRFIPFEHIIIHNILNDQTGKRMSSDNKNLLNLENVPKRYHNDAIRYSLFRATTFEKETANFSFDFLDEGQYAVYRIGNLRKFFVKHKISFENLPMNNYILENYFNKMEQFNLKGGFDIGKSNLQILSKKIKQEHDTHSLSNFKEKAIQYKTGIFMMYPFMPEICSKSINVLRLNK